MGEEAMRVIALLAVVLICAVGCAHKAVENPPTVQSVAADSSAHQDDSAPDIGKIGKTVGEGFLGLLFWALTDLPTILLFAL
jgi:hypothetical protein